VIARYAFSFKNKKRRNIMRLVILAAAATLVLTGTVTAKEAKHHYRDANASVAEGSAPADTLSAHDAYIKNLHDAGYNPASDRDAAGNIRQY
jgi:hypothetical protein